MKPVMRIKVQLAKVFIALVLVVGVVDIGLPDTSAHAASCTPTAKFYWPDKLWATLSGMAYCKSGSGYVRVALTCVREVDGRYPRTYYGPWVWSVAGNKASTTQCGLKGYYPIKVWAQTG
ncbi:hypothetical protein [Paenibacillus sp. HJGM_3]|uniref:hypothetical protein n=1 Tax=Paenibacillus sp. HJGM_3 TaxID=3379816 RepID=UPI00385CBC6E